MLLPDFPVRLEGTQASLIERGWNISYSKSRRKKKPCAFTIVLYHMKASYYKYSTEYARATCQDCQRSIYITKEQMKRIDTDGNTSIPKAT